MVGVAKLQSRASLSRCVLVSVATRNTIRRNHHCISSSAVNGNGQNSWRRWKARGATMHGKEYRGLRVSRGNSTTDVLRCSADDATANIVEEDAVSVSVSSDNEEDETTEAVEDAQEVMTGVFAKNEERDSIGWENVSTGNIYKGMVVRT